MIEGVSRPLYDGYTNKTELTNFLVKHGMANTSSSACEEQPIFPQVHYINWEDCDGRA